METLGTRILTCAALWLTISGCTVTPPQNEQAEHRKADTRLALAQAYLRQGEPNKAWKNLTLAHQYAPNYLATHMALAHYYEHVGEFDRARQEYQDAFKHHPQSGELLNNYGAFICKQGQYVESLAWFAKARQQNDYAHIARNFENAGYCALKAQRPNQAIEYFAKSVLHDPTKARTWLTLVDLEIQYGQVSQAQQHLKHYIARFGENTQALRRQRFIQATSH